MGRDFSFGFAADFLLDYGLTSVYLYRLLAKSFLLGGDLPSSRDRIPAGVTDFARHIVTRGLS